MKPSNILIKDGELYITGFSSSLDWSDRNSDETEEQWDALPHRYAAPEIMQAEKRDSSSDIWSLGCVYLEMWTALKGRKVYRQVDMHDIEGPSYTEIDPENEIARMEALPGPPSDNLPIEWIRPMLQRDRKLRPTADALLSIIRDASTKLDAEHMFIGQCCLHEGRETESAAPSTGDA